MKRMDEEKQVTIVIPTYNRADIIVRCVKSVLESDYTNIECVVVDNRSEDDSVMLLTNSFGGHPKFRLIRLQKNLMAGGGRNAGILAARGDIILFLDSDNIIESNMISHIVKFYETHADAGLVAPISADEVSHIPLILSAYHNLYSSKTNRMKVPYRYLGTDKLEEYYETALSQNCFAVCREAVELVGGFDPVYGIMYEESDLAYRILKQGFKNYTDAGAVTHHMQSVISGDNAALRKLGCGNPERTFLFARNRCIFEKKFAGGIQKVCFFVLFVHVFVLYYFIVALKNKRADIGLSYIKGTFAGYRYHPQKNDYIDIRESVMPYWEAGTESDAEPPG